MKQLYGLIIIINILLSSQISLAHVPYIEKQDYSEQNPFIVKDNIENSKSVYAWFEDGNDVDVYTFEVTGPVMVFAQAVVPVCPEYVELLPWLAVVGPGLPEPDQELPFSIPDGYGAVVVENLAPGEDRDTFYESFGRKDYYDAPSYEQQVTEPGTWYVYYWDPAQQGGDYVAILGFEEVFSLKDIFISLITTPKIWLNRELHTPCQ